MRVWLSSTGLYVIFRWAVPGKREALGFVIKPRSAMVFSERAGLYRRAFALGPLYFRTYALKGRHV